MPPEQVIPELVMPLDVADFGHADAVRRVANDYDGLEIVLAHFDKAQPLLRQP